MNILLSTALILPSLLAPSPLLPEEEPFLGHAVYDEPTSLEGEVQILVVADGHLAGTMSSTSVLVQAEPEIRILPDLPGDAGFLFEEPSFPGDWTLHYLGQAFAFQWDPGMRIHRTFAAEYELLLYRRPELDPPFGPESTGPEDWELAGPGHVSAIPMYKDGAFDGIKFVYRRHFGNTSDVDWFQFISTKAWWSGTDDAGKPVGGPFPVGSKAKTTSNGGPDTTCAIDGTTTYVDSGDEFDPEYTASGTGGDDGTEDWMQDRPGLKPGSPAFTKLAGLPPDGTQNGKIVLERTYTTYLVVDGQVEYRFEWVHTQEIPVPHPGGPAPPGVITGPAPGGIGTPTGAPQGQPADEFDQHHEDAKEAFEFGHYTGAPNPGT